MSLWPQDDLPYEEPSTYQDAYDVGYADGVQVGRELEREEIAARLARDVGGRVEPEVGIVVRYPKQLGYSSWAEVKAKRERQDMADEQS
jgi:hypothetical protein